MSLEILGSVVAAAGVAASTVWSIGEDIAGVRADKMIQGMRARMAGRLPQPRNHELLIGIRTSHLSAIDNVARRYSRLLLELPAHELRDGGHRRFEQALRDFLDARLDPLSSRKIDIESVDESQIKRVLDDIVFPPSDADTRTRQTKAREIAEASALQELATQCNLPVPRWFERLFKGEGGSAWYDLFSLSINNELKSNSDFRSVFFAADNAGIKALIEASGRTVTELLERGVERIAGRLAELAAENRDAHAATLAAAKSALAAVVELTERLPLGEGGPLQAREPETPAVSEELAAAAETFASAALPPRLARLQPRAPNFGRDLDRSPGAPRQHEAWREGVHRAQRDRDDRIPVNHELVIQKPTRQSGSLQRFALVLGEPGAGKTTLLETWAASRLGASAGTSPEVALIRLGRLTPGDVGALRGADAAAAVAGTTVIPAVGRLPPPDPAGPPVLWLLDGLDELGSDHLDSSLVEALAALPGRVVVSCRTAIWQSLGADIRRFADPVQRYEILPLDRTQQTEMLTRPSVDGGRPAWRCDRAVGLIQRIGRNAQMRETAGNPQLLELIAEVDSAPGSAAALPASRAAFFAEAVNVRWQRVPASMRRRLPEAVRILYAFAGMLRLDRLIGTAMELADAISRAGCDVSASVWHEAFERAGLLTYHGNQVTFQHLTLHEYFLASGLLFEGRSLRSLLDEFWMHPRYEEILAMALGLAGGSDQDSIDACLAGFVEFWLDRHRADPQVLRDHHSSLSIDRPRSPLRTALHLITRSGDTLIGHQRLSAVVFAFPGQLRCSLAGDGSMPADALDCLAGDADVEVRRCAADNIWMPAHALDRLSSDHDVEVRQCAAGNPSTPAGTLSRLADDDDALVRRQVAGNPSTPTNALDHLVGDDDDQVREHAASNPSISTETRARLDQLREWAARRISTPDDPFLLFGLDDDWFARLAKLPGALDPKLLTLLSHRTSIAKTIDDRDDELEVRRLAARNPSTSAVILTRLAHDRDDQVRLSVAGNLSTPADALAHLARDKDYTVRLWAIMNESTLLEDLAAPWPE